MDTPVRYQVVFSGRLREGYTASDVKRNLTSRLKVPVEKVEQLFTVGRAVLKQTPSLDEAKRFAMQLAAGGAITTIEPSRTASVTKKPAPAPAANLQSTGGAGGDHSEPKPFSPVRPRFLLKPLLLLGAAREVLLNLLHITMILALIGGVLLPSLSGNWLGQYISSPLAAQVLQSLILVIAGLLLLLILKPLLALKPEEQPGIPLTADQEPELLTFIEEVCEEIGVPLPAAIRLQEDAGIRVGFHRGPQGWLENRTILTIGVPLIAGLNRSQLAALLACNLSRYRHNAAPRTAAIVLHGHAWLRNAVHGEDTVDRFLRGLYEDGRLGAGLFSFLKILLSPSRRMAGWRLRLMRVMDRGVIHRIVAEGDMLGLNFSGKEGFLRMLDQACLLEFVSSNLLSGLQAQWQSKGMLPGNLVQLMVLRGRQYPADTPQKLRQIQERRKAADGDIMPSDNQRLQRIANAEVNQENRNLSPASSLIRHYSKLTRTMTLRYYHHRMRLPISPYQLQQVSSSKSPEHLQQQRLDVYFRKLITDFTPLKLRQRTRDINSLAEAKQQWSVGVTRIQSEYEKAKQAKEQFDNTEDALVDATTREEIHLAGLWRQWGEAKLNKDDLDEVHQCARDSERDYQQALLNLENYLKAYSLRLSGVLAALNQNEVSAPELNQEVQPLLTTLEHIEGAHTQLRDLKMQNLLFETLLSQHTSSRNSKLDDRIEQQSADVRHLTRAIGFTLKNTPYPFADGKARLLMSYVLRNSLEEETPQGDFDRAYDTVEILAQVQRRALARLIVISEQVEKALGLR